MLSSALGTRIFICTSDIDMRQSFDALSGIVGSAMNLDPQSGYLFVFRNKRGDRIKVLYWDNDGFAMWYKMLPKGTFEFPDLENFSSAGVEIEASTLRMILDGIDLSSIRRRQRFRRPSTPHMVHDTTLQDSCSETRYASKSGKTTKRY